MHRPFWRLGRVIPCLLAVVFLLDVGLRLLVALGVVPIDRLSFRAWEPLLAYRATGGPFEPNRRYHNGRSYGDLAAIGNLPELREYRTDTFTTDALGYRNPPRLMHEEINAILTGDSYAVGIGVPDDETLSARLSRLTGCAVYNASGEAGLMTPDWIAAVAGRLRLRNRLVIRLLVEEAETPDRPPSWKARLHDRLTAWEPPGVRSLVGRLRGFVMVSPLQILSGRVVKSLENDRTLPNRYADNVVRRTLYNGDTILFRASWMNTIYRRHEVDRAYWTWLRENMRRAGLDLWIVLVPSKYTVYRPYLTNQEPAEPVPTYLDRVEREIRLEGVPVLNLTPLFRAQAARALAHGKPDRYLYWLDDIHWNARGIELAAAAIRDHWPAAEVSCGATLSGAVQKP